MKLNITLTQSQDVAGNIIVVIFSVGSQQALKNFNINNISGTATIISILLTPAPISQGDEVLLTTPTLPVAPFYGFVVGESASGTIADIIPLTAYILNSQILVSESGSINKPDPISGITTPGKIAGYRVTFP